MLLFAAATGLEKLEKVPPSFWLKALLMVAVFVGAVIALRKIAKMNKVLLTVIVLVTIAVVGFSWIYERNEPAFMTPVINKIAPFLPSKVTYGR